MLNELLLKQFEQLYFYFYNEISAQQDSSFVLTETYSRQNYLTEDSLVSKSMMTSKEQIASIWGRSPRRVQSILESLTKERTITWLPTSGRGGRSSLIFLRAPGFYYKEQLKQWIKEHNLDAIYQFFDGNEQKIKQYFLQCFGLKSLDNNMGHDSSWALLIPNYSSSLFEELYQLDFLLDPSKQYLQSPLIRWLRSCSFEPLFYYDQLNRLQSGCLRRWLMDTPRHWRFYIRSRVRFHHGKAVDAHNVMQTLVRLKNNFDSFDFIDQFIISSDKIIDIYLKHDCLTFPELIALFAPLLIEIEGNKVYGTGPYEIAIKHRPMSLQHSTPSKTNRVLKSKKQDLILKRYDHYWSELPEIEQIQIYNYSKEWVNYLPIDLHQFPVAESLDRLLSRPYEHDINKLDFDNCYGLWFNLQHKDFIETSHNDNQLLLSLIQWLRPEHLLLSLFAKQSPFANIAVIAHSLRYGDYDDHELQTRLDYFYSTDSFNSLSSTESIELRIGFWHDDYFCEYLGLLIQAELKKKGILVYLQSIYEIKEAQSQSIHLLIHNHMVIKNNCDFYGFVTNLKSWLSESLLQDFIKITADLSKSDQEQTLYVRRWISESLKQGQLRPLFHLQQRSINRNELLQFSELFWQNNLMGS